MAEIPEHLLKRSKARRAALDGQPAEEATETTGAAAATEALTDKPGGSIERVAPQTETGDGGSGETGGKPLVSAAAPDLNRLPWWIIPFLVLLVPFTVFYAGAFGQRETNEVVDPMVLGQEVWNQAGCSGCHGSDGGGGAGPALADGEVLLTFPTLEEVALWAENGSPGAGIAYGDAARPGGQRISGWYNGAQMPGFGSTLTPEEIDAVAQYVYVTFGGGTAP